MNLSHLKVAIATDNMTQLGGADRFLMGLTEVFPDADIYSAFYNPDVYPKSFQKLKVQPLFKGNSVLKKFARSLSFLHPFAFERLDLGDYDLVITLSAGAAKHINTRSTSKHVSIIFTPPHFQFGKHRNLRGQAGRNLINNYIAPLLDPFLRVWDSVVSKRADYTVSISKYIQNIVKDIYGLESDIIYPPVEVSRFTKLRSTTADYFLIISRLFEYKRIDRAIETCNKLNLRLKIIGTGPDLKYLQSMAGPKIEFLGETSDKEVEKQLSRCKALIFPGIEDFGITPIEAMAAGKPVIAYHIGGVRETVIASKTGEFFRDPQDEADLPTLEQVLAEFNHNKYNVEACQKRAGQFSKEVFIKNVRKYFEKIK